MSNATLPITVADGKADIGLPKTWGDLVGWRVSRRWLEFEGFRRNQPGIIGGSDITTNREVWVEPVEQAYEDHIIETPDGGAFGYTCGVTVRYAGGEFATVLEFETVFWGLVKHRWVGDAANGIDPRGEVCRRYPEITNHPQKSDMLERALMYKISEDPALILDLS